MNQMKWFSLLLLLPIMFGCSSPNMRGVAGPEIVSGGYSSTSGTYAEVGVRFSSTGDFVALVNPNRWKSPLKTGGSLSWMNPVAWNDDTARTGRILLGEAAFIGGAVIGVAVVSASEDGGGQADPPPPGPPPPRP